MTGMQSINDANAKLILSKTVASAILAEIPDVFQFNNALCNLLLLLFTYKQR